MEVVERSAPCYRMLRAGGPARLTQKETDRLADAIVSIEYYMETVKAGRSEPWYMLDNAEACLAVLRDVEKRMQQTHVTGAGAGAGRGRRSWKARCRAEGNAQLQTRRSASCATDAGHRGHAVTRRGARC